MTELIVHRQDHTGQPQMAETPLDRLQGRSLTSSDHLFVVHHYPPPPTDAAELGQVTLRSVDGHTVTLALSDLQELPQREVVALLECAGNGRRYRRVKASGTQFGRGLCGAAKWTGVSVHDVLSELRFAAPETLVVSGLDSGWTAPENAYARFAKGLPRTKLSDPDTIIAWSLNDEPLPPEHGGPLRLVVPGWAGVWWVKWISTVECRATPFRGFWQNERYTYQGEAFPEPIVVESLGPRALITSPWTETSFLQATFGWKARHGQAAERSSAST